MGRKWRVVMASAMFFVIAATPALAADGEPAIDINDFLPSDIRDWNGDGVPDQFDDKNGDGLPGHTRWHRRHMG